MSLKQRLAAFFFCVDCGGFTLTGWRCRICGRRLCFDCAGGYAMCSLYSPGFEMCEACKDEHLESIRANFPIGQSRVYDAKKQRTHGTLLTSSEISGRSLDWFTSQDTLNFLLSKFQSITSLYVTRLLNWSNNPSFHHGVKGSSTYTQPFQCLVSTQYFRLLHAYSPITLWLWSLYKAYMIDKCPSRNYN